MSEKSGRVFYPAMRTPALANVLKEFLGEDSPLTSGGPVRQEVGGILRGMLNRPPRTTLYFLFRGTEPLELTIQAGKSIPLVVQPRNNPACAPPLAAGLVARLCRPAAALAAKARLSSAGRNVPGQHARPAAESAAARAEKQEESGYRQFERELGALAGSEGIRTAIEQDRVLGLTNAALPADQPLPTAPDVAPLEFPEPPVRRRPRRQTEPGAEDRAHRPARARRVLLHPLRQLRELPLVPGHAGHLGRRPAEPGRHARPERSEEPADPESTRPGADPAFPHARRHGDFRRGDGRHRSVDAGRRGHRLPLRGPQRHAAGFEPLRTAGRAGQGRQGQGGNGQDRGAECLLSFLARRVDPFLLRGQRRLPFRDVVAGAGGPLPANGQGRGLAGQFAGIPPRPQRAADRSQRRGVRLLFRRLLPQLHEPRLPHRVAPPPGGRHRHRDRATGEAQRGHGRKAGRHDRGTDRRRVPAARIRPAARRQPCRDRQGRGL